jgi:restriction system protein
LGFAALQVRGKVGDGGIDFEGVLDVLGVASIKLQVQVKRYTSTSIGEKDIRNFRGALKRDHQGTFITLTSFQKKAIESAADANKVYINLIDGKRLIEIFIEQYDKVIQLIEIDANADLLKKLKFRKIIIPQ